jgi:hypothetical protein
MHAPVLVVGRAAHCSTRRAAGADKRIKRCLSWGSWIGPALGGSSVRCRYSLHARPIIRGHLYGADVAGRALGAWYATLVVCRAAVVCAGVD